MPDLPVVYECPKTPFMEFSRGDGVRRFRKELIYAGDFVKKYPDRKVHFTVNGETIDHWVKTFREFKEAGIEVPVPLGHTTNPELRRGTVVELESGTRADGKTPALYGVIQFRDDEAARLALTANASIFTPPSFTDGKGKDYRYPLTHVALTDYPVVPGLAPFEAIVASLESPSAMSLQSIAEKVGIAVADKEEAALEAEIVTLVTDLQKKVEELTKQLAEASGEEPAAEEEPVAASHSLAVRNIVRDNRKMKIKDLVQRGKVLPAAAKKLEEQYASDKSIALALSNDSGTGDNFDSVLEALELNQAISLKEQTKGQIPNTKDNPLMKDAQQRAERANRKKR